MGRRSSAGAHTGLAVGEHCAVLGEDPEAHHIALGVARRIVLEAAAHRTVLEEVLGARHTDQAVVVDNVLVEAQGEEHNPVGHHIDLGVGRTG